MGLLSYVRSRKSVNASRADGGVAAVSTFAPPRAGAGAPRGPLPQPKRESGNPPSSNPKTNVSPAIETGQDPYTKNLYSSNEPEKKSPKGFHYGSGFGGADWSNQEPGRKGIDAI
jgi:hypothetical protein